MREGCARAVLGRARSGLQRPAPAKALTWVGLARPRSGRGNSTSHLPDDSLRDAQEAAGLATGRGGATTSPLRAAEKGVVRGEGRCAPAFGTALVRLGAAPAGGGGSRGVSEVDGLRQRWPPRPHVVTDGGQTPEAKDRR